MINNLTKRKVVLFAIALLALGGISYLLLSLGGEGSALALMQQSWQGSFGDSGSQGLVSEVSLDSSSTLPTTPGQEKASASQSSAWAPLLIPSKSADKVKDSFSEPSVSNDLESSVSNAVISSSMASTSTPQSELAPIVLHACDPFSSEAGDAGVIFNEIAWMGSAQNANEEWLELKNISGKNISLAGWQILNRSGSLRINISSTTTIPQEGFLVLERTKDYSGALNNSGDWLKLFNPNCKLVDELDASNGWPAGNNETKNTLERDVNVLGWHTSKNSGGSRGAQNSVLSSTASFPNSIATSATSIATSTIVTTTPVSATSTTIFSATSTVTSTTPVLTTSTTPTSTTASFVTSTATSTIPKLVIAVVQITGGSGSTDEDYIKIFNSGNAELDISGWKLRKRTKNGAESSLKIFPDGSAISSKNYFVWANSLNGFSAAIGANVSSTQSIAKDSAVALLDASDTIIDALGWGAASSTLYIEGLAYPENPGPNQQLARKFVGGLIKDSDNNTEDFELH